MNFMFLVGLPFRGTFQFSFTVLVHYRFTTEYLALDRQHDPYSVSTLKLAYSQVFVSIESVTKGTSFYNLKCLSHPSNPEILGAAAESTEPSVRRPAKINPADSQNLYVIQSHDVKMFRNL